MKILAAFDGSEESMKAVEEAASLAKNLSGSVTVLNVYWDRAEQRYSGEIKAAENIAVRDEGSLRILKNVESLLKDKKVEYNLRTERSSNVPKAILRIAENENYDCIALGSRGLGGAKAWVLGSVSSRIIAESSCPVIVV
jgi:nucleotide-binding universal stress UspA family protein